MKSDLQRTLSVTEDPPNLDRRQFIQTSGIALSGLFLNACSGAAGPGGTPPLATGLTIIAQPVPTQTVEVGQSATFAVIATSTESISYQWQKDGVDIVGAQSLSYTTPALNLIDSGALYNVVVTSLSDVLNSDTVTVVVVPASITADATDITIDATTIDISHS